MLPPLLLLLLLLLLLQLVLLLPLALAAAGAGLLPAAIANTSPHIADGARAPHKRPSSFAFISLGILPKTFNVRHSS